MTATSAPKPPLPPDHPALQVALAIGCPMVTMGLATGDIGAVPAFARLRRAA